MSLVFAILLTVGIVSIIAKHNIQNETRDLESIEKDILCGNLDGNWERWNITKDTCIKKDYMVNEPPNSDGTTPLLAGDWNTSIIAIDEKKKTIEIGLNVELIWEDARISTLFANGTKYRGLPLIRKNLPPYMWTPSNEIARVKAVKYLHDPIVYNYVQLVSNTLVKRNIYYPNATLIRAHIEWHVIISCNFDFSKYPFDDQSCYNEITIWDANVTLYDLYLGYSDEIKTTVKQGFVITKELAQSSYGEHGLYGYFSTFGYKFYIKRIIAPYFYQYYIPCLAIVLVSLLSFMIPILAIPGRVGLVVTQFLTLTNLFIHQRVESPSGSVLSALDYYMLICLLFVFGTMIEFSLNVLVSRVLEDKASVAKRIVLRSNNYGSENKSNDKSTNNHEKSKSCGEIKTVANLWAFETRQQTKKNAIVDDIECSNLTLTTKIDISALAVFAFSFFLFNIIYYNAFLQ